MTIFYSASTGGFYDSNIHGKSTPLDAVEITDDTRRALLDAQTSGKIIQADANGYPKAVDPPAPTAEQLADTARAQRDSLLTACDWTALSDVPLDDTARSAWMSYRQALRDVPTQAGFPDAITWPTAP